MVAATGARRTRRRTAVRAPKDLFETPAAARPENRAWEPEEDETLLAAVENWGSRWKMIARTLAGRTEAMCRNRYQRIRAPLNGAPSRNRCTYCGELKRGHTCWKKKGLVVESGDASQSFAPLGAMPPSTAMVVDLGLLPPPAARRSPLPPPMPSNLLLPLPRGGGGRGGFEVDPAVAEAMRRQQPCEAEVEAAAAMPLLYLPPRASREPSVDVYHHAALYPAEEARAPPLGARPTTVTNPSPTPTQRAVEGEDDETEYDEAEVAPAPDAEPRAALDGRAPPPVSGGGGAPAVARDRAGGRGGEGGRTPPPPLMAASPTIAPCDEPSACLAPPKPQRFAHSFDLHALLAGPPTSEGGAFELPLDAVTEALLGAAHSSELSSQDSIGTYVSYAGPYAGAPCGSAANPPERDHVMMKEAMKDVSALVKLPSWSRAPSFSAF